MNADYKNSVNRKRLQLYKRKRIIIAESAQECGWDGSTREDTFAGRACLLPPVVPGGQETSTGDLAW